ncbi:hypothetical protein [Chroococcidiopsis sp.]|uniref:hypothetical protein n=1 Tax=Chroococcidiopsis sp. TaxID=3088168 RepID=UPI003F2B682A
MSHVTSFHSIACGDVFRFVGSDVQNKKLMGYNYIDLESQRQYKLNRGESPKVEVISIVNTPIPEDAPLSIAKRSKTIDGRSID